jgi:hypothetical protein
MGIADTPESSAADPSPGNGHRSFWVPCIAAWLVPGAGHLILGKAYSALGFALIVLLCFGAGVMAQGTAYAMDPEQPLSYLATLANLGVGPLDLWARHATFGEIRFAIPDSRVDTADRERILRQLRRRHTARTHTYGRTFLLTAGLMNLLLILDVYDYCIGRKILRRGEEPGEDGGALDPTPETPA